VHFQFEKLQFSWGFLQIYRPKDAAPLKLIYIGLEDIMDFVAVQGIICGNEIRLG